MTKEQEKIQEIIEELEATQAVVESVKAVVKTFDGKCYNCRLKKAIEEQSDCWLYENHYCTDSITIVRRHCNNNKTNNVAAVRKSDFLDGKRINAEKLIAAIDKAAADRAKKIFTLQSEMVWAEGAIEAINQQIRELNKYLDGISSETFEIYKNKLEWRSYRLH